MADRSGASVALVRGVAAALDEIAATQIVWPRGLVHAGGPHRRLPGNIGPISIGEDECALLGTLVETFRPRSCFIVGNAFGLSSAYIASAMMQHGGEQVVTLDAETEGNGAACAAVARALAARLRLSILHSKKGFSPRDVPQAIERDSYDVIFLDGCHHHPAPEDDLRATMPFARPDTIVVFHDYWIPGVRKGVRLALDSGYRCWWVPTSCEMVLAVRDGAVFDRLAALFPEGDADPERRSRSWLRIYARILPLYAAAARERLAGRSPTLREPGR
jgi:predicted O-methyltransferase YrrM